MTSRTASIVLWISAPVIAFAIVGGFLSKVTAREDTYQHLQDLRRRREPDLEQLRREGRHRQGHGRRDARAGRQPRSRQRLSVADQVKQVESGAALPAGDVGIDLTRQYYLRVIAARDGSPAAKAGLRTGDYIRAINDTPTREMSVFEGMRALRGAAGTKVSLTIIRGNANDPHVVELTREARAGGRRHRPHRGAGRRLRARSRPSARRTADQVEVAGRRADEERRHEADRRRAPHLGRHRSTAASRWRGCSSAAARWRMRETKGRRARNDRGARPATAPSRCRRRCSIDTGTSARAELFASALVGNKRAELIGEHTIGRAASQKLVKLPDGSGLWLTTTRYLTPDRHAASRKRARADRRRRRARRRVRPAAADRAIPILEKALEQTRREEGGLSDRDGHRRHYRDSDDGIDWSVILNVRLTPVFSRCRRVAQRLERLLDTQEVGGSSPPVPTIRSRSSARSTPARHEPRV